MFQQGRKGRRQRELSWILETACTDGNVLKALCIKQAEELRRNEEEISALKKQVMEITFSVSENDFTIL